MFSRDGKFVKFFEGDWLYAKDFVFVEPDRLIIIELNEYEILQSGYDDDDLHDEQGRRAFVLNILTGRTEQIYLIPMQEDYRVSSVLAASGRRVLLCTEYDRRDDTQRPHEMLSMTIGMPDINVTLLL